MINVGRICMKIAGREAGRKCVVVEVIDQNFVMVDGNLRRKRCNISHLEPLDETIELQKGASHDSVEAALGKLGLLSKNKKVIRKPKAKAVAKSLEKTVETKKPSKPKAPAKKASLKKETKPAKKE